MFLFSIQNLVSNLKIYILVFKCIFTNKWNCSNSHIFCFVNFWNMEVTNVTIMNRIMLCCRSSSKFISDFTMLTSFSTVGLRVTRQTISIFRIMFLLNTVWSHNLLNLSPLWHCGNLHLSISSVSRVIQETEASW